MAKTKKIIIVVLVLVIIMLGYEFLAYRKSDTFGVATLSWNSSADTDLAGYKIYYGTSPRIGSCPNGSGYSSNIDVGSSTSYTIDKLENTKTYYFSVSAYDSSGNESCFTDEARKTISAKKTGIFKYILGE